MPPYTLAFVCFRCYRLFYSFVPSALTSEWKRGCRWPYFVTNLSVFVFYLFKRFAHEKEEVFQETRSALAQVSVPCKGQRTKHTTAKRPFVARIHRFYIDHNAPCLLHKSLQNHCFQFLLEKFEKMVIAKFCGVNKVHTGLCENGEFRVRYKRFTSPFGCRSRVNGTLPGSKNPHLQNEVRYTTFPAKMSFICLRMKNDFRIKGWAPTLVLKQRPGGTRKWLISRVVHMLLGP